MPQLRDLSWWPSRYMWWWANWHSLRGMSCRLHLDRKCLRGLRRLASSFMGLGSACHFRILDIGLLSRYF